MLLASATQTRSCLLACSPSIIDHYAHFAPEQIKSTAWKAFACESIFCGLVNTEPDHQSRLITGLERYNGPGFFSGASAGEVFPVLLSGTLGRIARTLTTSSMHCLLQQGVIALAGSDFFLNYFTSEPSITKGRAVTQVLSWPSRLSSAVEAVCEGILVALLYEYALGLQGMIEGLIVDYTRGEERIWQRAKHLIVVPTFAAIWDGVFGGVGYFVGLGVGRSVLTTFATDLFNYPRNILPVESFFGK